MTRISNDPCDADLVFSSKVRLLTRSIFEEGPPSSDNHHNVLALIQQMSVEFAEACDAWYEETMEMEWWYEKSVWYLLAELINGNFMSCLPCEPSKKVAGTNELNPCGIFEQRKGKRLTSEKKVVEAFLEENWEIRRWLVFKRWFEEQVPSSFVPAETRPSTLNAQLFSGIGKAGQQSSLNVHDVEYEECLHATVFQYLRRARLDLAGQLFESCQEPWRTALLLGGHYSDDPVVDEREYPTRLSAVEMSKYHQTKPNLVVSAQRRLWKGSLRRILDNGTNQGSIRQHQIGKWERAVYAILSGHPFHDGSLQPVLADWMDILWAKLIVYIDFAIEDHLDHYVDPVITPTMNHTISHTVHPTIHHTTNSDPSSHAKPDMSMALSGWLDELEAISSKGSSHCYCMGKSFYAMEAHQQCPFSDLVLGLLFYPYRPSFLANQLDRVIQILPNRLSAHLAFMLKICLDRTAAATSASLSSIQKLFSPFIIESTTRYIEHLCAVHLYQYAIYYCTMLKSDEAMSTMDGTDPLQMALTHILFESSRNNFEITIELIKECAVLDFPVQSTITNILTVLLQLVEKKVKGIRSKENANGLEASKEVTKCQFITEQAMAILCWTSSNIPTGLGVPVEMKLQVAAWLMRFILLDNSVMIAMKGGLGSAPLNCINIKLFERILTCLMIFSPEEQLSIIDQFENDGQQDDKLASLIKELVCYQHLVRAMEMIQIWTDCQDTKQTLSITTNDPETEDVSVETFNVLRDLLTCHWLSDIQQGSFEPDATNIFSEARRHGEMAAIKEKFIPEAAATLIQLVDSFLHKTSDQDKLAGWKDRLEQVMDVLCNEQEISTIVKNAGMLGPTIRWCEENSLMANRQGNGKECEWYAGLAQRIKDNLAQ